MKPKFALLTLLGTFTATVGYRWLRDSMKSVPKTSDSTTVSTDPTTGNKLIEVTGVGGTDAGKKVQGYELPSNISDLTFPVNVIVKPNQNLFLIFNVGQTATIQKRDNSMVYWEGTGNNLGTYLLSYDELIQKTLKTTA